MADFVVCIEQHARDHGLGDDACYWVCAYANNQWALGAALDVELEQTSFHKALTLAVGTVSVLDRKGVTYTRVWCCYEIFVSLGLEAGAKQYDVYTAHRHRYEQKLSNGRGDLSGEREAVGICSRPAVLRTGDDVADTQTGGVEPAFVPQKRESPFPLRLARQAFGLRLQDAQASFEPDRVKILNTVAGRPLAERAETPLHESAGYDELNDVLRGRFAASAVCALFDAARRDPARRSQAADECALLLRAADARRPAAPSLRGAALVRACSDGGREGCVRALLGVGADVNHADALGRTPLMNACGRVGDDLSARALIDAKANLEATEPSQGGTALIISCENGHERCVQALVAAKANLEAMTNQGLPPYEPQGGTALMKACQNGHDLCARALIDAGAQIEAKAKHDGFTALML